VLAGETVERKTGETGETAAVLAGETDAPLVSTGPARMCLLFAKTRGGHEQHRGWHAHGVRRRDQPRVITDSGPLKIFISDMVIADMVITDVVFAPMPT
jgi:hypothetical protein